LMIVASLTGLAAMALGLMISALVSNPDKALTILPVVLLAQFLLSGAFFNVSGNVVLQPISYVTSARWGFAAAASTSSLQQLPPSTCGAAPQGFPKGTRITAADDPVCDRFRKHDAGTLAFDNAMIVLLTILPMFGAWIWVRRVGRPRN